jgi:hypothetical protein
MSEANTPSPLDGSADPLSAIVNGQAAAKGGEHPEIETLIRGAVAAPGEAEQFDPATHEVDPATGGPVFNSDGSLRKKRGRRKGINYAAAGEPGGELPGDVGGQEPGEGQEPPVCSAAQAKREARMTTGILFKGLAAGLGEHWEPTPEEAEEIQRPLAELLKEKGGIGMPPWAEVAFALGMYALARLDLRDRLAALMGKATGAIAAASPAEPRRPEPPAEGQEPAAAAAEAERVAVQRAAPAGPGGFGFAQE